MSGTLRTFSEVAAEAGIKEIWVPLVDGGNGLLGLYDGHLQGIEVFITLKDLSGPVAESLAETTSLPVPLSPEQFEETLKRFDPDHETFHFVAVNLGEHVMLVPLTQEGKEHIEFIKIEESYQELARQEGAMIGRSPLDKGPYSC